MKIALVMTGGGAGGLQQSIVPYAAALARSGHAILAVVWKGSPFISELRQLGVEVVITRWRRKPWPFTWLQAREIRAAAARFSAEIAITFASKGLKPTWIGLRGRVPVLTHCGATRPRTIKKLLGADGLIVTTREMEEIVRQMGMPPDRIYLLPNFLIGDPIEPEAIERPVPVLGSLGRFVERKGFDALIKACALLVRQEQPVRLLLGGTGVEQPNLEALAHHHGVDATFLGWVSNSEKGGFFSSLDIFVCPSRSEPFGYIYLEAMRAGIPVVATETVGSRFIFQNERDAIIVPQDDIEALAKGIATLIDSSTKRLHIAKEAQTVFRAHFHIDAASDTFDGILSEAARQGFRSKDRK